jgi:DNA-binding MarR family transcriptional regulator
VAAQGLSVEGPDEVIHQSTRLKIAATLNALSPGESLEFGRLKAILGATDGNMATHLGALERAGYIAVEKDFVGKKPRTRVSLSKEGRRAFERHVAYLKDLLDP